MKLKKGDMILVRWLDTYDPALPAWAEKEDIDKTLDEKQGECVSIGFFYCFYGDWLYLYGGTGIYAQYERVAKIPKGCVKKIRRLK